MKYKTQKEVEEEFDEKFPSFTLQEVGGLRKAADRLDEYQINIPKFISTLRTADLDAQIDHLRGIKQKLPEGKCLNLESHLYGSCFQCERIKGRNQAIDDHITYLETLKKDLA